MTGTSHYDGPLSADGRMVFDAKYRITLHPDAPFGIVSMKSVSDFTEYSKTVTVRGKSTRRQISLVEVGQGAQSSLRPIEERETKVDAGPTNPQGGVSERKVKAQPKDSLPQIRELDRIFQAKDGEGFREFVLLGSPAWQKALDNQVRVIETKEHSIIDIVSSHVDGPLVRVGCRLSVDGKPLEHVASFAFVKRGEKWKMLVFFVDENLEDVKTVLSDAEWKALNGESDDAKAN